MHPARTLLSFITAFTMLLFAIQSFADTLPDHTTEVAENIYSYGNPNMGYFSMFVVTEAGVAVFETVNTTHAEGLLAAIRQITDKPIRKVFHSHNHWDHSGGGKVFQDIGAKTIAHEQAYEWMLHNPHPDMALPSKTWKGTRKNMRMGSTKIELHFLGMNHGLGMTVFVLPEQRIAYIADLVTPNRVLFAFAPDFNIRAFEASLKKIETLDFDYAVYSHSHASPFESKSWVTTTYELVDDIRNAIYAEFANGTPFGQIPNVIELPQYSSLAMYNEWLSLNAWRIMIDDVVGPYPWTPYEESKGKGKRKHRHQHEHSHHH
jgi:glyoxylase-like metal-dependent hydrolase (beta-lactamase superfamily II)